MHTPESDTYTQASHERMPQEDEGLHATSTGTNVRRPNLPNLAWVCRFIGEESNRKAADNAREAMHRGHLECIIPFQDLLEDIGACVRAHAYTA